MTKFFGDILKTHRCLLNAQFEASIFELRNDPSISIRMAWIELVLSREAQNPHLPRSMPSLCALSAATTQGLIEKMLDPEERVRSFTLERLAFFSSHLKGQNADELVEVVDAAIERMRDVKESVRNSAILFLCAIVNHQLLMSMDADSNIAERTSKIIDELFLLCSISSPLPLRLSYISFIESSLFPSLLKSSKGNDITILTLVAKHLISSSSDLSNSPRACSSFVRYLRMKVLFHQWIQSIKCAFIKLKSDHDTLHDGENLLFHASLSKKCPEKDTFVKYSIGLAPDFIRNDEKSLSSLMEALFDNYLNVDFGADIFAQLSEISATFPGCLSTPASKKLLKNILSLQNGHSFYCSEGKVCQFLQSLDDTQCRWLLKRYPPLGFAFIKQRHSLAASRKHKLCSIDNHKDLDDVSRFHFIFASFYYYCDFSSFSAAADQEIHRWVVENISGFLGTEISRSPDLSSKCIRVLLSYMNAKNISPSFKFFQDTLGSAISWSLTRFAAEEKDPVFVDTTLIRSTDHIISIEILSALLRSRITILDNAAIEELLDGTFYYLKKVLTSPIFPSLQLEQSSIKVIFGSLSSVDLN